jgi:hypothetical protein
MITTLAAFIVAFLRYTWPLGLSPSVSKAVCVCVCVCVCVKGVGRGYIDPSFFSMRNIFDRYKRCPPKIHMENFCKCLIYSNKGLCHIVALPFTLKSILMQNKRNYGNSNISPCKNIIFKKTPPKETKILQRYYNTL